MTLVLLILSVLIFGAAALGVTLLIQLLNYAGSYHPLALAWRRTWPAVVSVVGVAVVIVLAIGLVGWVWEVLG